MPVLMPVVETDSDVVDQGARAEDQQTLETFLGDVIQFGPGGISARGESMEEAILAAVDLVWQAVGDSARLTREVSGEIELAGACVGAVTGPCGSCDRPPVLEEPSTGPEPDGIGFSESEEAFFDGYAPEEPLGREELLSMFDPAKAWAERRVGRQKPAGAKGRSGTGFRFLSLIR